MRSKCLDHAIAYATLPHEMLNPIFAEDVKKLRMTLGLSQKTFALELGVSYATINRWEKGHSEPHKLVRDHFEAYKMKALESLDQ